jgi:8-oxo-dGTP pyrophosphatase MutT (NUDIX family)
MSATTKRDQDRPTFLYNGQPVRAAGLLAYVTIEGRKHYLLRSEKRGRWSDIGGKTDAMDEDIISVVVREVTEETNNHLFSEGHNYEQAYEFLNELLRNEELEIHYCPKGKYILLKIELDIKYTKLDMKRFGLREKTDGISAVHYYSWLANIYRNKLHPRLRYHADYYNLF